MKACVSDVVVERVVSPSGEFVATLREIDGGATTDFAYQVDLQKRGFTWYHKPLGVFWAYGAVRSHCAYGLNLRWLDANRLEISYLNARNSEPAKPEAIELDGNVFEVVVRSGVDDPEAPCGSMEYNEPASSRAS